MNRLFIKSLMAALLITVLAGSTVLAAKPADKTKPGNGGGKSSSEPIGYDVSWPQCGKTLPSDQAFGIVGVNGGHAANHNPCLAEQLVWASTSTGTPNQDKIQLYVNTANPGEVIDEMTSKWPESNTAPTENPYGECDGTNNRACSWQYGWDRAEYAVEYFTAQAQLAGIDNNPSLYKWWLDVETMNTWQSGSAEAYQRNVAALEGWVAYFDYVQARTGLYSTAYQWGEITGSQVGLESNLNGLDSWLAGSRTLKGAKSKCSLDPLTSGGQVVLTQYVQRSLDHNYSCVG